MTSFLLDLPIIGVLFGTVLPFLIVLAIVIFIHEYGHYIVGRWCGIHSEEFSLGFGPEVFGWTDKRGTRWRVAWIPLGGFVRFKGDADAASSPDAEAVAELTEEERRQTLPGAPLWARAATVAAGPLANFILAVLVFALVALATGRPSNEPTIGELSPTGQAAGAGLEVGDRIVAIDGEPVESFERFLSVMLAEEGLPRRVEIERDGAPEMLQFAFSQPPQVGGLVEDGPAALACMKVDDVILSVDGAPVGTFADLQATVLASEGATLAFVVQRGPELITLDVAPRRSEFIDPATGSVEQRVMIGVQSKNTLGVEPPRESMGVGAAIAHGFGGLERIVFGTLNYLGAWISGSADGSALGGPIGIARASGQTAQDGLITFIAFIATVSAAIGFINLFPIPMLDGGHLVFYALEAVRGRPLNEQWIEWSFKGGLAAILLLLLFATYNDLARWATGVSASC